MIDEHTDAVFENDGARITVALKSPEAFVQWAEADDVHALIALFPEVRAYLIENGVKRVSTSVPASDERIFKLAEYFGFVPVEVLLVLPLEVPIPDAPVVK